ncbi:hypothetical protein B7C51_04920 [Paenibacillus larvae subsp. pulvifaciens]|uniref:Uncharacterized protein n=1 Tax=Paenibacillus larvae subsp. pulvifaciens TaxID=1477 RepID=A0A1V0UQR5_9BACL|nr:hypothetical protein [Paenibacillus larvae]ARF67312.1 hypothetical protein B7C51_04920 [Paenibacillus larvae subsp. pulvifaciens]
MKMSELMYGLIGFLFISAFIIGVLFGAMFLIDLMIGWGMPALISCIFVDVVLVLLIVKISDSLF